MDNPSPALEGKKPTRRGGSQARVRRRISAGLILVLPIWVTFLLVSFVFRLMRDTSLWVVEAFLMSRWGAPLLGGWGVTSDELIEGGLEALPLGLRWGIAAFSVMLTVCLLYIVGMVTTNIVGRRLLQLLEAVVDKVPLVKTVYRASKQVLETLADESGRSFQRVALVPFPNSQMRSVGFVTKVFRDGAGEELCAVFIATTPNPTTGFLCVVRRSEVIDLDWSVEEAVRVIMSGGVLFPPTVPATLPPADAPTKVAANLPAHSA
jgi:uncharacterized membrane protein